MLAKKRRKLKLKWKNPKQVVRLVSEFTFEAMDFLDKSIHLVHADRMKKHDDSSINVSQTLLDTIAQNDVRYQTVTKILGLRINKQNNLFEMQCCWRGFDY